MTEKVFEVTRSEDGSKLRTNEKWSFGDSATLFAASCISPGQPAHVTVRVEPCVPVGRVPWPWPDIKKVMVSPAVLGNKKRRVRLFDQEYWMDWIGIERDMLGHWRATESRIAEYDNGFVKLSEVPNSGT